MDRADVGAIEDLIDCIVLREHDATIATAKALKTVPEAAKLLKALRRRAGPDWVTAKAEATKLVAKHRPLVWADDDS